MRERLTAIQEAALDHLVLKHFEEAELSDAMWCKLHDGVTQRTLTRWKHDADPRYALFQHTLKQRIHDYDIDRNLTSRLMRVKALEALYQGLQDAQKKDKRAWVKELLLQTQDVENEGEEVDYTHMTTEQLEDEMLARGLSAEQAIVKDIQEVGD